MSNILSHLMYVHGIVFNPDLKKTQSQYHQTKSRRLIACYTRYASGLPFCVNDSSLAQEKNADELTP